MSASLRRPREFEGQSTEQDAGLRHFIDLRDFDGATLRQMLDAAASYKRAGVSSRPLAGKTLAVIFEKPSTRTRVSFEVGMRQLGGEVVVLSARGHAEQSRGDAGGYGAGAVALCRCDHAAHRQRVEAARVGGSSRRCR